MSEQHDAPYPDPDESAAVEHSWVAPLDPVPESKLEPDEFYYDGPYLVFTERYHLRRGSCCESGCRHCPFGFNQTVTAG